MENSTRHYWPSWAKKLRINAPHSAKKKVLFHQDNARVQTCAVTMAKLYELKFELVSQPLYTLDLALSDFFLFPNMKKLLARKRYKWKKI